MILKAENGLEGHGPHHPEYSCRYVRSVKILKLQIYFIENKKSEVFHPYSIRIQEKKGGKEKLLKPDHLMKQKMMMYSVVVIVVVFEMSKNK